MADKLVSAVALYGPKERAFQVFLDTIQGILGERLGTRFRPYRLDQIHGTIIRLDGVPRESHRGVINGCYLSATNSSREMKFALALKIFDTCLTPPIGFVFGGYRPAGPATFTSQGKHPYERMFAFRENAFVLIGWPLISVINGISQRPLDRLRRELNSANIWHYYHQSPIDVDNDLHLVLGHLDGSDQLTVDSAVQGVRSYMTYHPFYVEVGVDQISIVAANAPSLSSASFVGGLSSDPEEIATLYH
jgi:hypothetical protein